MKIKKNCEVQKENNNNKLKIMEKFAQNFPQIESLLSSSIGSGRGGRKTIEKSQTKLALTTVGRW